MTQDDIMTTDFGAEPERPNVPYTLHRAYMALRDNGVKPDLAWMKHLRVLTETQMVNGPLLDELRTQRELCLNTVKQLQEQVDTLRRINKRYGEKIYDTDKSINEALGLLQNPDYDWGTIAMVEGVLDEALADFPKELVRGE